MGWPGDRYLAEPMGPILLEQSANFVRSLPRLMKARSRKILSNVPLLGPLILQLQAMGFVWERQIRTVRIVMYSLSREFDDRLDQESFYTLMCEIEATVTSRPLTTVSSDPSDDNPLTPSHPITSKFVVLLPLPGHLQRAWRLLNHKKEGL